MDNDKLPQTFISYTADVLADTSNGLSGSQIVKYCNAYAVDFDVDIPFSSDFGKFGSIIPNKRTALCKNLLAFNGQQQFIIIKELTELPLFDENEDVKKLHDRLIGRYSAFSILPIFENDIAPTGWERVDRTIDEMKNRLKVADSEEKYQAIGMLGREVIITISQQVFKKDIHKLIDGVDISITDSKRMLEAYLSYELKEESEKVIKFARSAVDMCNQLTHDRKATKRAASICIAAVSSVAQIIYITEDTKE